MKKLVFVIAGLQNYGGTERVASLLANELSGRYDITILSQEVQGKSNTFPLFKAVKDVRLERGAVKFPLAVKKYVEINSPDLVVIHTMSKLTLALLMVGVNAKNLWSLEHTSYLFSPKIYQLLRKCLYPRLSKIITLTEQDKLHYQNINKSVDVIYNASPLKITQRPYLVDSKVVLSIGQLEPHKGFDLLLEAWKPIESLYPDWQLHIYGEGPDIKYLTDFCKSNNIRFVKFMGLTDKPVEAYDSAAIYVMSSRFEGLGLVLLEAQSRGVPTISFDCPYGPAEIINNNKDGILVPPKDTHKLTEALLKLIESEFLRKAFSERSLENAKKFEKKSIINKWISLIEKECQ